MRQGKGERKNFLIKNSLSLYLLFFISIKILFAQYREPDIFLPDSFGGLSWPAPIVYAETEDKIYIPSAEMCETVVAIDCENDEKIFPIRLERDAIYSHKIVWHKNNNYIYLVKLRDEYLDSILIFNGHNHQKIKSIPLPINTGKVYFFISNYINNKLYLNINDTLFSIFLVIDGDSNNIIKEINITRYKPLKFIFSPFNNSIYFISDSSLKKVYLFSCELDSVIDSISLSPNLWWTESSVHLFLDSLRNHLIITGLKNINFFLTTYIINYHTNQIVDSIVCYHYPGWIYYEYNFRRNKLYFWSGPSPYNEPPFNQMGILDIQQRTLDIVTFDKVVEWVTYNHHNDIVYCDISREDIILVDGNTNRIIGRITVRDFSGPPCFCHPKRNKIYINLEYFSELAVIDGEQNVVRKYVKYGSTEGYTMSYNPLTNKIYKPEIWGPYIMVLDGETHKTWKVIDTYPLTGQIWFWFVSSEVCTSLNKIYFSTRNSILVMDGTRDSIIKIINGYGGVITYNPFNNKLYVVSHTSFPFLETNKGFNFFEDKRKKVFESQRDFVCIIDCHRDTILKVLPIPCRSHIYTKAAISPDGSKIYIPNLYYFPFSYFVICSFGDTLIKEIDSLSGRAMFKNNSDTLYIGCYDYTLNPPSPPPIAILNWKKDTIINKINGVGGVAILYNPINNYLYSVGLYPNDDKIFVVDCATNNVIDTIFNVSSIHGSFVGDLLIWNPITDKIYGEGRPIVIGNRLYRKLQVVDCRLNQIVKTILIPKDFRLPYAFNPRQNRLYFDNLYQSKLIVIKDEITGIYSSDLEKKEKYSLYPTIGKDFNIILKEKDKVVVYNSIGRKVKSFIGKNISIRGLKKGIYFVKFQRKKELKKIIVVNDL